MYIQLPTTYYTPTCSHTINRTYCLHYFSSLTFFYLIHPNTYADVNVLITSDCDATTYVPIVSFSDDNTKITVDVQGSPSSDNTFLQNSTSYKVEWSAPSDSYHHPECGSSPPPSRLNEGREISFKSILVPNSNIKEVFRRILGIKKEEPTKKIEQVNTELSSDPQCNVNAEILYDSCTHNMEVLSAPKVRVIDGYLNHTQHRQLSDGEEKFVNFMNKDGIQYVEKRVKQHPGSVQHRDDDESCVTEFRTQILYRLQPGTLAGSPLVPQVLCNRPKNGGPRYIDGVESDERR